MPLFCDGSLSAGVKTKAVIQPNASSNMPGYVQGEKLHQYQMSCSRPFLQQQKF